MQNRHIGAIGEPTRATATLVKRSVPVDAELTAGVDDRAAPARIDPDSFTPDTDTPPPGRAAQLRGGLPGRRT